jgi:hypothetical protein
MRFLLTMITETPRIKKNWGAPQVLQAITFHLNHAYNSEYGLRPYDGMFGTHAGRYFQLPHSKVSTLPRPVSSSSSSMNFLKPFNLLPSNTVASLLPSARQQIYPVRPLYSQVISLSTKSQSLKPPSSLPTTHVLIKCPHKSRMTWNANTSSLVT